MHILETKSTITAGICDILPGKYVVEDFNGAQFMLAAKRGDVTLTPHPPLRPVPGAKNVLLVRPGAYGDLLLLTPSIKELKRRTPGLNVTVASFPRFQPILLHGPADTLIDYPVPMDGSVGYDSVVYLENTIEGNAKASSVHAIDLFAEQVGLDKLEDRTLSYTITEREKEWASARYERTKAKRVAIHVSASTASRNYPEAHVVKVVIELLKSGIEVYLIGAPHQWGVKSERGIRNLMLEGLDIRQSIAAMATCDALIAPDSVMLHAAAAIGMKAVGLYGPVHWSNRVTGKTITALQGNGGCDIAPCNYSAHPAEGHFPANCPSRASGKCCVMDAIKPERVVAKVQQLLK